MAEWVGHDVHDVHEGEEEEEECVCVCVRVATRRGTMWMSWMSWMLVGCVVDNKNESRFHDASR